jgi:stalled ribosome rescue protein Dom34
VQDSKYLEREKHQLKAYFNNLADAIGDADAIALFGPAETNEKFRKELSENHKTLAAKLIAVTKADSMTPNQIKALVRDFF